MSALFDYSEKSTDWIRKILDRAEKIIAEMGSMEPYNKIRRSCFAELEKRGVEP